MKKYFVSIVLIVAVLCSLCVFSVSATEQENIHISSTEFQVRQGSEFTTTIFIADDANIIDFEVLLKYDPDKLTLVSATENEDIRGTVIINAANTGSIGINYSKTSGNVTKKTLLVDLTFRVDEYLAAGTYDCLTIDKTGPYIAHRLVDGSLEDVALNCKFASLSIYEIGDVDLNHKVDIGDVTYLRRHLANLQALTEFQLLFANTQNDDVIDIGDAIALQRNLVKLEVSGYGDRINVLFCNTNGDVLTKKSVKIGTALNNIPEVPYLSGYTNGRWSLSKEEYVAPDFTNLTSELTVYAIYEVAISPYMQYYMSQVSNHVNQYNGIITTNWDLPTVIEYADNTAYTGKIVWRSSDGNVFSNSGVFNKQTYDRTVTLTAEIYSYLDSTILESTETLTFTLLAKGAYSTPTKAEIVQYLQRVTNGAVSGTSTIKGGEINCDLNLIRKISNEQVNNSNGSVYEVRIEWEINDNGVYNPISQIQRGTSPKTVDLVAAITFNGKPLEDDGKVYFDDVKLTAITEEEIRCYIISQIASKVQNSFSDGDALWDEDTRYGCEIKWISNDIDTVSIEQNTVTVNDQAVNGTSCSITAQVTYPTDTGSNTFNLEYVITVDNPNNTLLQPGVNVSESLHAALMIELRDRFGYTQLTTEALKNTKFVSLDLSKYNDWFEGGDGELHAPIKDLTGLTYCENLRLLNISGLKITKGVSEIAGLKYLESFIANNVGISSEDVGGTPILSGMINLKLVDLSNNNLTSLNMFFSDKIIYGRLKELYLDNNQLEDISLLSQTPLLTLLTLSNNDLESDDIKVLSNQVYLTYLSLNHNRISDISSLKKLTMLTELRLHCNNISDISPLENMTAMKKLYLGENKIIKIDKLKKLTLIEVLYLNDNANLADISVLDNLNAVQVLNISNCSVNQIVDLRNMTSLRELYAENNEITGFTVLSNFVSMEKLLLAGNERSGLELEWNEYIGGMANLKVLTLSGLDVRDLSFLETSTTDASTQATTTTTKPIQRLEIADCGITSSYSNEDASVNNMEMIKKLKSTLKYLDISNNPINTGIDNLGHLGSLELLYADNIDIGNNIVSLMANSQSTKYLSLENCNISSMYNKSKPWLSTSYKYVFIDLAGNPIEKFDFECVSNSVETLKSMYVDTTSQDASLNLSVDFADNVLEYLSLEGYSIKNVNLLPNMLKIKALNLKNTGLTDFIGEADSNGEYPYSLGRYENLEYLDVSQSEANIFTKANLEMLYKNYANIYVNLYADNGTYAVPVGYEKDGKLNAKKEATKLLELIDNMESEVTVSAERISDNNPTLIRNLGDYAISWDVSDEEHYSVETGKLAVKTLEGIQTQTLTLTATVDSLYGESNAATRKFDVKANILTLSNAYISSNASGANAELMRGDSFCYDFKVVSGKTDGFNNNVTPVNCTVTYVYEAKDVNGNQLKESDVLEIVSEVTHKYQIKKDAPLDASVKITVTFNDNDGTYTTKELTVTVVPQTYKLTFKANGGTVTNAYGETITELTQEEETELDFSQSRSGYEFEGWYLDAEFTEEFTAETMPSENITIYAKWRSYKVSFNSNGGSACEDMQMPSEGTYITLPKSTRTGHKFAGWYSDESFAASTKVGDAGGSYTPTKDCTLHAKWTANEYTITYDTNGGVAVYPSSLTVIYGECYPELPTPRKSGYTFAGWYYGTTKITTSTVVSVAQDHMLVAKWTANKYTVTLDTNGGTAVSPSSYTVTYGNTYPALPTPTRAGYDFIGWYAVNLDGNPVVRIEPDTKIAYAIDHVLRARWLQTKVVFTLRSGNTTTKEIKEERESGKRDDMIPWLEQGLLYNKGYRTLNVTVRFQAKEKYDGYQWLYVLDCNGEQKTSMKFEHDTSIFACKDWKWHEFSFTLDLKNDVNGIGFFYLEWGATGTPKPNTWELGETQITITARK